MFVRDLHNLQHTMDQMFDSMMSRYDHMGMGGIGNMGNMGMVGMDDDMMMGNQSMNRGLMMDDKDSSAMQVGAHTGNRKHRAGQMVRRGESEMMHDRAGRHGMMGGMLGNMMNMPVMNMQMSPIDLKESPNEYVMTVEMAGVDRKSIDIAADKDKHMVTIRAEKREEHTEGNMPDTTSTTGMAAGGDTSTTGTTGTGTGQVEGQAAAGTVQTQGDRSVGTPAGHRYHLQERKFGMVERSLRIPDDCDFDHADASYENGVLKLRIPRMAKPAESSFTQKIHLS